VKLDQTQVKAVMQMLTVEYKAQRVNAQYENCPTNEKLTFHFSFDSQ
jgi:hypothetical protein